MEDHTAVGAELHPKIADYILSGKQDDQELTKSEQIVIECVKHDEPFFVLRAKDIFSVMAIRGYQKMVEDYGPYDQDFQIAVASEVENMRSWQFANAHEVRYPD